MIQIMLIFHSLESRQIDYAYVKKRHAPLAEHSDQSIYIYKLVSAIYRVNGHTLLVFLTHLDMVNKSQDMICVNVTSTHMQQVIQTCRTYDIMKM